MSFVIPRLAICPDFSASLRYAQFSAWRHRVACICLGLPLSLKPPDSQRLSWLTFQVVHFYSRSVVIWIQTDACTKTVWFMLTFKAKYTHLIYNESPGRIGYKCWAKSSRKKSLDILCMLFQPLRAVWPRIQRNARYHTMKLSAGTTKFRPLKLRTRHPTKPWRSNFSNVSLWYYVPPS